jgi:glycosyltransferase involved in cell wall biosynthesis
VRGKKKILISLTYYLPNVSGLTEHVHLLAEDLAQKGYQITILTSKHQPDLPEKEIINKVEVIRIKGINLGKGIIMPGFLGAAIRLGRKADVVNCHLPSIESLGLALLAKLYHQRLIVTYHCYFESGNWLIDKIIHFGQWLTCGLADKIVVNTKDYMEGNGLMKAWGDKMVEIIPPIQSKPATTEEIREIAQKITLKKGEVIIGFIGRISKEKNLEVLIEAIPYLKKKLKNFRIILAGPETILGEKEYQRKVERRLAQNQLYIKRIGKVTNPTAFYQVCDCLVLPSKGKLESFGLVQAEAILSGTPMVASNLPGVRMPIRLTGMGEVFESDNPQNLADKIEQVVTRGKEYYQKRLTNRLIFNLNTAINKYEKTFTK